MISSLRDHQRDAARNRPARSSRSMPPSTCLRPHRRTQSRRREMTCMTGLGLSTQRARPAAQQNVPRPARTQLSRPALSSSHLRTDLLLAHQRFHRPAARSRRAYPLLSGTAHLPTGRSAARSTVAWIRKSFRAQQRNLSSLTSRAASRRNRAPRRKPAYRNSRTRSRRSGSHRRWTRAHASEVGVRQSFETIAHEARIAANRHAPDASRRPVSAPKAVEAQSLLVLDLDACTRCDQCIRPARHGMTHDPPRLKVCAFDKYLVANSGSAATRLHGRCPVRSRIRRRQLARSHHRDRLRSLRRVYGN